MVRASRGVERRRSTRLPLAVPIFVRGVDENGKEFLEFTTAFNISASGSLLATRRYLPRGSHVSLEIPAVPLPAPVDFVQNVKAQVVQVSHSERFHLCRLKNEKKIVRRRRREADRRRWERLPLAIPVFARGLDEDGKEFVEFTNAFNVNAGGALLATRRYLAPASQISLEVASAPVPRQPLVPHFIRTLRAKVIRGGESNGCHLSSLRFARPIL
ncbi:MAG: PilZ domain-containing protein [Terriglobia bacterium]